MNLKKFALRGLAILAVFVALCMFFSGTIKTITTAKVKITRGRSGRLEEKIQLTGKLTFPDPNHQSEFPPRIHCKRGRRGHSGARCKL